MKKVLLTLAVLGTISLSGCEKDEALVPVEKTSIKADDAIMCGGCGQWDIVDPNAEGSSLRIATTNTQTDTTTAPAKAPKRK